ncbi:MAG: histidine phosphatase family protein [Steroidobacteraceae bacterium]
MEFVLIRHTRCEVAGGTCYGRLDVPLASSAAEDIAHALDRTPRVDRVCASPAQRCLELARKLAMRDRCELRVLDELQELDFGAWEGMSWGEIPRPQSDEWAEDPWNRRPARGETESELWARVTSVAEHLLQATHIQRVAVVSHGGPLRILRSFLTQAPASDCWSLSMELGEVVLVTANLQR